MLAAARGKSNSEQCGACAVTSVSRFMMFKIVPTVAWQVINDETVIINLSNKRILGLNDVGTLIWSLLETSSMSKMTKTVVDQYGVDHEVARGDINAFIAEMQARGLIEVAK